MNTELLTKLGTFEPDNLIARVTPPAETFGVELAAGAGLVKRGTLLGAGSGGVLAAYGEITEKTADFTGNGSTKKFTVSDNPAELKGVTVGGTDTEDYTYDDTTGEITFTTAPANAAAIKVTYDYSSSNGLSANCILADDVDTGDDGTADPVGAVAYRSGCFNRAAVIGELTDADEDAFRKYGIVFFDCE